MFREPFNSGQYTVGMSGMERSQKGKTIFIMVDGFGVPPEGWPDSVFARHCGMDFAKLFESRSIPIGATLGVEGIPQSATGQTSLFTGVNAAKAIGRHAQGFPGPTLREIVMKESLFSKVIEMGWTPLFANAYIKHSLEHLERAGLRSVTTVMASQTLGKVLGRDELIASKALYHDLTRESLEAEWGVPATSPEAAARDLVSIAEGSDLVLFEYFMTDRAGHKCDAALLGKVLSEFGRFVVSLAEGLPSDMTLILTSDHGNCEAPSTRAHTRNPVPLLILNSPIPPSEDVRCICGITPLTIEILSSKSPPMR